jgi:hypothetical protein
MGKREHLPDHAIVVTAYDEFHQLVQAYVAGHHELMTIIGGPGLGKSEEVKRQIQASVGGGKWTLIKGKQSPLALYQRLYQSRLLPVVLDDLDGLIGNPDTVAILKCVCDIGRPDDLVSPLVRKKLQQGREHHTPLPRRRSNQGLRTRCLRFAVPVNASGWIGCGIRTLTTWRASSSWG